MPHNKTADRIPEEIYLCQISETVSCGACCGLYNVADASRRSLLEMLNDRTDAFSALPRDMEAILSFGSEIENQTKNARPFPDFHHCPFLGLIGPGKTRVGCLLHPQNPINMGVDYRGLSYYGGLACDVYFCPSSRLLPPVLKKLIQQTIDDWYWYGLVITEDKLITSLFNQVEKALGRSLTEKDLIRSSRHHDVVRDALLLKCNWTYRTGDIPGRCHYFFSDRRYSKPPVQYANNEAHSPFHDIFYELISWFDSPESLKAAEVDMQILIDRLAEAFSS